MTIYEAIGLVCASMTNKTYIYGSPKEVAQRQMELYKDPTTRSTRLPATCLLTPIQGKVEKSGDIEYECNIVFIMSTEKTYTAKQRLDNVYKITLHPMVANFFDKAKASKYIQLELEEGYEQTDAFYYPGTPAEEQNTMAAILDAVEIKKLKIKLFKSC